MKIDTSKIKDNVAVHCPKKENVAPLLKAIGVGEINIAIGSWHYRKEQTCFIFNYLEDSWSCGCKEHFEERGYTIIEFEDLITPESNLSKELGIPEGVEFIFKGSKYIIHKLDDKSQLLNLKI